MIYDPLMEIVINYLNVYLDIQNAHDLENAYDFK